MKYISGIFPTYHASHKADETHKRYPYLCLENIHDVEVFSRYNSLIKSHQSLNFWKGFKSQSYYDNMVHYGQHNGEADNSMSGIMATMGNLEGYSSIFGYAKKADSIIEGMNRNILKFVLEGRIVRIAANTGYCPIDSLEEYDTIMDINEEEALNFLLHKTIDFNFEITKPFLVIENDQYIPVRFIDEFCKKTGTDREEVQVLNSFKQRTLLFRIVDYKNLFEKGIENGLQNIVVNTSAQDIPQLNNMKSVLESVMWKYPEKTLNVHIKISEYKRSEVTTTAKNINIVFL